MKKILLLLSLLLLLPFYSAFAQTQVEIDGVIVPRTIDFQNKTLTLNGVGGRSKMWVEVYIQALYLSRLSQDAKYIIESDTEMAIRIHITSSLVSSGKLTRNFNSGFEKSTGENLNSLRPKIEAFKNMLSDQIVKDDVFNLVYNPIDTSVWVYKNEVLKGKIAGIDFKKALFGIWLSDKPVDETLKNNLLGIY
ncbi:chalcone isomerase family protein [Flavobacterium granuli]|uniref:Chalcone isomerase-like n=1 Tax=Flavobacterium granuli TaxID=280093 RepID=A0A1M5SRZ8_9FLAO|nr:chalcone isomerase family protein [Flavobacterium granuli]PRZ21099.1 chalcone isomerase-like protein [Flavobacterium granuli]SHH41354.1 Chalcone isomerase-like [Flavobacterium granuli]